MSVKLIIIKKKIIVGILLNVLVKMVNIQKVLLTFRKLCVMNLQKPQKVFQQKMLQQKKIRQKQLQQQILQQNFSEKNVICKVKNFTYLFIIYSDIINSCYYLFLHKDTGENQNICYHITTSILNQIKLDINNIKMESNKLKEVDIECRRCYYFDDITKFEGFDSDNILIDEKSYENILIYDISY